ncbi:hypothetical protein B0J14DRAFT_80003 [Halenospora varia]|nr:hypothetical protein B0J14DRAFT_80003 [Halenospora varia]
MVHDRALHPMRPERPNCYMNHDNLHDAEFLDYALQHDLLSAVQSLLEEVLFYFAKRCMPKLLKNKNWTTPLAGELNTWWGTICNHNIHPDWFQFRDGNEVQILFNRIKHIRHTVVHRLQVHVEATKNMLRDAVVFASGFKDEMRRRKLRHLQDALHSRDNDAIKKAIATPTEEFKVGGQDLLQHLLPQPFDARMTLQNLNLLRRPLPPPANARLPYKPPPGRLSSPTKSLSGKPVNAVQQRLGQIQGHYNLRSRKLPSGPVIIDLISDDEGDEQPVSKKPRQEDVIDLTGDSDNDGDDLLLIKRRKTPLPDPVRTDKGIPDKQENDQPRAISADLGAPYDHVNGVPRIPLAQFGGPSKIMNKLRM